MSYDIRITKAVLVLYKWFGQLYGVLPFASKSFIFVHSRPWLWYSRLIAALLLVIYPCAYIILLKNHTFPMLDISYYLVMIQFTINYIIVIVLYLQVLFDPSSLLDVLNELIESAQAILRYTYSTGESTIGRRLLFKTIAIDILQSFSWYGTFIWLQRTFGLSYMLAFWLNTIAVMQTVSVVNILLLVLLWGTFLYRLINERIQIIIENLGKMSDPADLRDTVNHDKRTAFTQVCRQLSILRTHHNALTKCVQNIVQFYDVPLGLAMLYQFFIIISELMADIPYPELSLVNYLVCVQMILHYVALTLMYTYLLPSRMVVCDILNSLAYISRLLDGGQLWKVKQTKKNILKNAFKVILSDNILCGLFAFYCGQYITRGNDIKNDVDVPLGTYMSSILFAAFEAIQFYYIISASSEITEQAEKTGILLNEFIPTAPNMRVEQCIESFTIELLHQDFKINNCGMYDVDYTLMFSMIATITSYLIMLVQFQLAEI
uniref:Gustatory receptor n=1 Tax=Anopheles minimus TaxID=112268 RepID=A0A182WR05_9DIPT